MPRDVIETRVEGSGTTLSRLAALHRKSTSGSLLHLPLRIVLRFLAWAYEGVARARNVLYDRGLLRVTRASVPVISVGNLTAGGTGKTPVVILLARAAVAAGRRPAILTRGYRRAGASRSDEVALIERTLPGVTVVVDPDRVRGAATAIRAGADLLILDDGFQHRRLARDVDLVLLDARDPFGGAQLPLGRRREPPASLSRASACILTRSDRVDPARLDVIAADFVRIAGRSLPIVHERHVALDLVDIPGGRVEPLSRLARARVVAFSGIGDPDTLRESLAALGADVVHALAFEDHHEYSPDDLARVAGLARESAADLVVTTEKDAMRIADFPPYVPLRALRIEARLESGRESLASILPFPLGY